MQDDIIFVKDLIGQRFMSVGMFPSVVQCHSYNHHKVITEVLSLVCTTHWPINKTSKSRLGNRKFTNTQITLWFNDDDIFSELDSYMTTRSTSNQRMKLFCGKLFQCISGNYFRDMVDSGL